MNPVVATPDVRHYSSALAGSSDDDEYLATVAEFPSLSWLEADQDAALAGIRRLVVEVVDDVVESGGPAPVSFGERPSSGEFRPRTTSHMHRRLTIGAAQQGVSLNCCVNSLLTR